LGLRLCDMKNRIGQVWISQPRPIDSTSEGACPLAALALELADKKGQHGRCDMNLTNGWAEH
jgi:hypothetical protein